MTFNPSSRPYKNISFPNRKQKFRPCIDTKRIITSPKVLAPTNLEYYQFTIQDPIGRRLIELIKQNRQLAKTCNLRIKNCSILSISKSFYHATMKERKNLLAPLSDPDLTNLAQAIGYKRSSKNKDYTRPGENFNYKSSNINGLIRKINTAQRKGELSASEFRSALLTGTTGKDHMLVRKCLKRGESLESTYDQLRFKYHANITAREAKTHLLKFRAKKGLSLTHIEAHLRYLCITASSKYPKERLRTTNYNYEYCNALMRCLPTKSKIIVQTQLLSLSNQLGRSATAAELSAALNIYRHQIETDIYLHGSTNSPDNQGHEKISSLLSHGQKVPSTRSTTLKMRQRGQGLGTPGSMERTEVTLTRTVTK